MEYVIGLDFGSLSCRGILVDRNGKVLAESEYKYPCGVITKELPDGTPLEDDWVLQNPSDYENSLYTVIPELVKKSGVDSSDIKGIGIDATASTVIAIDDNFRPLCQNPEFKSHPDAWPKMWKHHAAKKETEDINRVAVEMNLPVRENYGGNFTAEGLIPKVIQSFRHDRKVFDSARTFLELGDWLSTVLSGKLTKAVSYLTCKAMCSRGPVFPPEDFFERIEPGLGKAIRSKFNLSEFTLADPGECIGILCGEMAEKLGLCEGIKIASSQMDGYAGLPGSGVAEPGRMMIVLGTSTGFMLLDEGNKPIKGMCASVHDSMVKGYLCHAAGQTGAGDNLAWFMDNLFPAKYEQEAKKLGMDNFAYITELASKRKASQSQVLALDWINGNKSVLADMTLSGLLVGFNLSTKPEEIFRALIEASAFGARVIIDRFRESGVRVDSIVASGGISLKNPFMVQLYSDVLGMSIDVCSETQAAAMGAAMYASSACGIYKDVPEAVEHMRKPIHRTYEPRKEEHEAYEELYKEYVKLHDYFGLGANRVMQKLRNRK